MKNFMAVFSNNLKKFRKERGWTQEALAEYSGLSHGYIAFLETAKKWPSKKTVEKIAKALDVPDVQFFIPDEPVKSVDEVLKSLTLEQLANYVPPSVAMKVLIKALGLEDKPLP